MRKHYDFSKSKRGPRVTVPKGKKTCITISVDDNVLAWFKAQVNASGGGNYLELINAALRHHITNKRESLETTLRRVIREELRRRVETVFSGLT